MHTTHDLDLGGGRSLFLAEEGAGRPIVLIHGALVTHVDWMGPVFDGMARLGRVLALDRPGHGRSRRPRFAASPAEQAFQIHDGLERLRVRRPVLVGHSFGGMVALAYAAAFPDEVGGLVLAAPVTRPEFRPLEHVVLAPRSMPLIGPVLAEASRWSLDPVMLRLVQRAMFAPQRPPDDWLARYPYDQVLRPSQMVKEGEDAAAIAPGAPTGMVDISAVRAPTVIVAGDKDQVVDPGRHAKPLHMTLPGSELQILPGVGHMLHHVAAPALLNATAARLASAGGEA